MKRAAMSLAPALLAACTPAGPPDMGPVGGGLSVIGLAIVVAAFIVAISWKGGRHG